MQIKLRYLKVYTDNRGALRAYFRRKGSPVVALPGVAGSDEFMAAYHVLLHGGTASSAGEAEPTGKTIAALVLRYYASNDWAKLRASSQSKYKRMLEWFRVEHAAGPVRTIRRENLIAMIEDRRATPAAADEFRKRMVQLFDYAISIGWRSDNPATDIKPVARTSESHRCWAEAEIAAFEAAHPIGTRARLAFTLALEVGARSSDVIRLTREHFAGRDEKGRPQLSFVQHKTRGKGKTGGAIRKPIDPKVSAVLAAGIAGNVVAIGGPLVTNDRGAPLTDKHASFVFATWRAAAGLPPELTMHGLRHARGRRLAEAGCTAHQIMADMGWQTLADAQRYCDKFSRTEAASAAAAKMARSV